MRFPGTNSNSKAYNGFGGGGTIADGADRGVWLGLLRGGDGCASSGVIGSPPGCSDPRSLIPHRLFSNIPSILVGLPVPQGEPIGIEHGRRTRSVRGVDESATAVGPLSLFDTRGADAPSLSCLTRAPSGAVERRAGGGASSTGSAPPVTTRAWAACG